VPAIVDAAKERLRVVRARLPVVDHAVRTWQHAGDVLWGQQAAAITYFGFLSVFPLLAIAFSIVAYLTRVYPAIREQVETAVIEAFPGLIGDGPNQVDLDTIAAAGTGAGIIGSLTLLWTGTGAVDAVRDGIRVVFGTASQRLPLAKKKLRDLGWVAVVGVLAVSSVTLSTVATQATSQLLGLVGLEETGPARVLLRVLTVSVAIAINTLILSLVFRVMSARSPSWRQVAGGALLGAVLLEILKLLATSLLQNALNNPLYAGFAVAVGLLLWINFSARVLMLSAAWVATSPGLLAADPQATAVDPAQLPLVVAPGQQAPARPHVVPGAVLAVVVLVALVSRRRRDGGT
jgi:membrane protein